MSLINIFYTLPQLTQMILKPDSEFHPQPSQDVLHKQLVQVAMQSLLPCAILTCNWALDVCQFSVVQLTT